MIRTCTLPAQDQLAIHDLLSQYNQAVGEGHPDAVAACFVEDGYVNGRNGFSRGTEALRKIGTLATKEKQLRHIVNNTLIRARPDEPGVADVRSHLFYFEVSANGFEFKASGIYTDVVVKVGDEWKFRSRVMTPTIGETWPGQTL